MSTNDLRRRQRISADAVQLRANRPMPYKRDPLKRLTEDEEWEVELLLYEIRDLYKDLGGEVCGCGKIVTLCKICCPSPA